MTKRAVVAAAGQDQDVATVPKGARSPGLRTRNSTSDKLSEVLSPVEGHEFVSAVDLVADSLRRAIARGRIEPGTRLRHEEVAQSLGVSRQPVREALRQLQVEGFVLRMGSRGYAVREFSKTEVAEAYHLRWLLESEAAYFAAVSDRQESIRPLMLLNSGIQAAHEMQLDAEMTRLNSDFHRLIRECTAMPLLVQLIDKIWVGITVMTPAVIPERGLRSVKEHEAIIAAIRDGRPEEARAAMREHIAAAAIDYYHTQGVDLPQSLRSRWEGVSHTRKEVGRISEAEASQSVSVTSVR